MSNVTSMVLLLRYEAISTIVYLSSIHSMTEPLFRCLNYFVNTNKFYGNKFTICIVMFYTKI